MKTSGQSTREKLRSVERHCTRPTMTLKMAETCRGVLGGSRASSRANGGQQPPSRTCAPVEVVVAVIRYYQFSDGVNPEYFHIILDRI